VIGPELQVRGRAENVYIFYYFILVIVKGTMTSALTPTDIMTIMIQQCRGSSHRWPLRGQCPNVLYIIVKISQKIF
jgi:hypothetical protein